MVLSIGHTLSRGVKRSLSRSGVAVFGLIAVAQLLLIGSLNTVLRGLLAGLDTGQSATEMGIGFAFPVSTNAAVAIGLGALLCNTTFIAIAARLLSREPAALSSLPRECFTRRIGWVVLSTLAVTAVITPLVTLGMLLIVPGLFLAVSFQFAVFAIAVEDAGPLTALRRSWGLARGNRWRLLALVLILAVPVGLSSGLGSVLMVIDPVAGQLVTVLVTTVFVVVSYGVIADAFVQLRNDTSSSGGGGVAGSADAQPL